jgi:hypothetical protein
MRFLATILAALALSATAASAQSLTAEDFQYLQGKYGITQNSAVVIELTPNEVRALHSSIDDLKSYPAGRDRSVQSYLILSYGRECKRWAREHVGEPCSPSPDPAAAPGKKISDQYCASCHLFGSPAAPSYHDMAAKRDWNAHKVSHALQHNPNMVPVTLPPEALDQLAAYINSLK